MSINLTAIYIANLMAIVLIGIMIAGNRWRIVNDPIERKCINTIVVTVILACIIDTVTFTFDGEPGTLSYICALYGNGALFCLNMVIGPAWSILVVHHVRGAIRRYEKHMIYTLSIIGFIIIFTNYFKPIVFHVDSNNVYHRDALFWYYLGMELFFIAYGSVMYCISKAHGGILKFFPVINFIIPIIIGIILQTVFYGVSTIPPFVAVSVCCMLYSLQNESIYRDSLTSIYNRTYLDYMKRISNNKRNGIITAIMIDLNDFKSINDRFGHKIGDEALIDFATILRTVIGEIGSVIRYAGDEFVILLNTSREEVINDYIDKLKKSVDDFNATKGKTYSLSFAVGYSSVDLKNSSVDELLNEVDHKMYLDKEAYYVQNPQKNRRKGR